MSAAVPAESSRSRRYRRTGLLLGLAILAVSVTGLRVWLGRSSDVRTNARDGSVLVYVPAGPFTMGTKSGEPDEAPPHIVNLGGYWIGRTLVTNAQFARFLNECGNRSDHRTGYLIVRDHPPVGIEPVGLTFRVRPGLEEHPASGVSFWGARAYCEWAGLRLPTEAEWEKAARGIDGRAYPWGNEWDPKRANGGHDGLLDRAECTEQLTTPVTAHPNGASPYGCLDMAGNLWEWCSTLYAAYPYDASDGREDPDSLEKRVIRGGAWYTDPAELRTTNRYRRWPGFPEEPWVTSTIGFRVAMSGTDAPSPQGSPTAKLKKLQHPSQVPPRQTILPLSPELDQKYRVTPGPHPAGVILGYPVTPERTAQYAMPNERMEELNWKGRDAFSHSDEVMRMLNLHAGETVADIGAGGGYWTFQLADAVGPRGAVWATDIASTALWFIQKRLKRQPHDNIYLVLTEVTDCLLPSETFDLILVAQNNYFFYPRARAGESPPRDQVVRYYHSIYNALKPGGHMCVVDKFVVRSPVPLRGRDGVYAFEVIGQMKDAGFALAGSHFFPRHDSHELIFDVLMFERPR